MAESFNKQYNYDQFGNQYSTFRRTDPIIAKLIHAELGDSKTVLNVGAGTGSYEPEDRNVIAVEPSAIMRSQRPAHLVPPIACSAEALPFDNNSFDAAMSFLSLHHWSDPEKGLREIRRVTKGPVLIVTFDPDDIPKFWLYDYLPEIIELDKQRFPSINFITHSLGGKCTIKPIPVPHDCIDGIQEAFYARPEAFLNPEIRKSQSAWHLLPAGVEERAIKALEQDLNSGDWDRRYGEYRSMLQFTCALRLIISHRPNS